MNDDTQLITDTIHLYFKGTYEGDATLLKQAFHADAHITGFYKDQLCDWTRDEFIARVTVIPTAEMKDETYDKKILYVDHIKNIAIVTARVIVGGLVFFDYITLLKIEDRWLIRNKSFTTE